MLGCSQPGCFKERFLYAQSVHSSGILSKEVHVVSAFCKNVPVAQWPYHSLPCRPWGSSFSVSLPAFDVISVLLFTVVADREVAVSYCSFTFL